MSEHSPKAMILAAGRGERMRPLTDTVPKPLLRAGGRSLIEYHIENLRGAGYRDIVVNISHLGEQLRRALGDGQSFGVRIRYSEESSGALETGGGIFKALEYLKPGPFLVVNGDVWTDYPYGRLRVAAEDWAHLVLVDNPPHHSVGDFVLNDGRVLGNSNGHCLTFSGIGMYRPALFAGCTPGRFPLAPLLHQAMEQGRVGGEHYPGQWFDVGTPERLEWLDRRLSGG